MTVAGRAESNSSTSTSPKSVAPLAMRKRTVLLVVALVETCASTNPGAMASKRPTARTRKTIRDFTAKRWRYMNVGETISGSSGGAMEVKPGRKGEGTDEGRNDPTSKRSSV